MRQVLKRFVDCEKRLLLREVAAAKVASKEATKAVMKPKTLQENVARPKKAA
jgi:hypothetical protein